MHLYYMLKSFECNASKPLLCGCYNTIDNIRYKKFQGEVNFGTAAAAVTSIIDMILLPNDSFTV
jgi:hypothetical protein